MRNWGNLILLVTTLVLLFFGLEFFGRGYVQAWPFGNSEKAELPYLTERDATLLWRFSPGKGGRNSLGLRNREIKTKKDHHFRILFIGDSLVWWGDTSAGKLYTQEIEERLNEKIGNKKRMFEVINAGIPGYTTYQELEFLKIYGLDMEPDMVILGFVFNDVFYKYLHRPNKTNLLGNDPTSNLNRFSTASFPGNIFKNSYAAHGLIYLYEESLKRINKHPYYPFEHRSDFYLAWKDYGWHKTKELIGEMNNLLEKRGIPLGVVAFPISDQVNDQYLNMDRDHVLFPQKKLQEICKEYNIPLLDLTPQIYNNGGLKLYRDYLHLNKKGNDVVGKEIYTHLIKNHL